MQRRSILRFGACSVAAAFWLQGARASETDQYRYDALGRLLTADSRVTGGHGGRSEYIYDHAGNRSAVQTTVVVKSAHLASGEVLNLGEAVISAGTQFMFVLQQDGNLVEYDGVTQPVFNTGTFNPVAALLKMQTDGNLVLYEGGQTVWASNTAGNPGAFFAIQDDGNIVVYASNGTPLWARFGL